MRDFRFSRVAVMGFLLSGCGGSQSAPQSPRAESENLTIPCGPNSGNDFCPTGYQCHTAPNQSNGTCWPIGGCLAPTDCPIAWQCSPPTGACPVGQCFGTCEPPPPLGYCGGAGHIACPNGFGCVANPSGQSCIAIPPPPGSNLDPITECGLGICAELAKETNTQRLASGAIQVTFQGTAGITYRIEVSRNLGASNSGFSVEAIVPADGNGQIVYVDNAAPSFAEGFYRASLHTLF